MKRHAVKNAKRDRKFFSKTASRKHPANRKGIQRLGRRL